MKIHITPASTSCSNFLFLLPTLKKRPWLLTGGLSYLKKKKWSEPDIIKMIVWTKIWNRSSPQCRSELPMGSNKTTWSVIFQFVQLLVSWGQHLLIIQYFQRNFTFSLHSTCVLCLVIQSCPTLWDPMHYSLPGSSVHGDSPGKNTGVGFHALLRGSFQPRNRTQVFHIAGRFFTIWASREAQEYWNG